MWIIDLEETGHRKGSSDCETINIIAFQIIKENENRNFVHRRIRAS